MTRPKAPTRLQLSKYFHDQDMVIRFQQLFDATESNQTILTLIETTADSANSFSLEALSRIEQLSQELEFYAATKL